MPRGTVIAEVALSGQDDVVILSTPMTLQQVTLILSGSLHHILHQVLGYPVIVQISKLHSKHPRGRYARRHEQQSQAVSRLQR